MDRKTLAIILGAVLGVTAVATAVGVYVCHHQEPAIRDVNEVFDEARRTLHKLDRAVETLRKTVA